MPMQKITFSSSNRNQLSIGLYHPLDVIINHKYKLLPFLTTKFFGQREEGTSF